MLIDQVQKDQTIIKRNNLFLSPSISRGSWAPEDVWNTGLVSTYSSSLAGLTVERYESLVELAQNAWIDMSDP